LLIGAERSIAAVKIDITPVSRRDGMAADCKRGDADSSLAVAAERTGAELPSAKKFTVPVGTSAPPVPVPGDNTAVKVTD